MGREHPRRGGGEPAPRHGFSAPPSVSPRPAQPTVSLGPETPSLGPLYRHSPATASADPPTAPAPRARQGTIRAPDPAHRHLQERSEGESNSHAFEPSLGNLILNLSILTKNYRRATFSSRDSGEPVFELLLPQSSQLKFAFFLCKKHTCSLK